MYRVTCAGRLPYSVATRCCNFAQIETHPIALPAPAPLRARRPGTQPSRMRLLLTPESHDLPLVEYNFDFERELGSGEDVRDIW